MKKAFKIFQVIILFIPAIGFIYALLIYGDTFKTPDVYLTSWFGPTCILWHSLGPIITGLLIAFLYHN